MSHTLPFLSDTHIYTHRHTAWWSIYDHTPPHCQCIKTYSQSTSDTITLLLFSVSLFTISFSVSQEVQFRVQSLSHITEFSLMLHQKPGTNDWVHLYQGCSIYIYIFLKKRTRSTLNIRGQSDACLQKMDTHIHRHTPKHFSHLHIVPSIVLFHISFMSLQFDFLYCTG